MLFGRMVLDGIARGEVTLAFRRWLRPTVAAGSRLRTAIGVVRIAAVEPVEEAAVTEAEARAAGHADRAALLADLRAGAGRTIYRVRLGGVEADARVALREAAGLAPGEIDAIRARFAAWERARPGHFAAVLRLIGERPGCRAEALADALGIEKPRFKRDVRRLKELGLTESLAIGYRLSPRGEAVARLLAGG